MPEPIPCDLCGTPDFRMFHFTEVTEHNELTCEFVPDFDQAIYCEECFPKVVGLYYTLGIQTQYIPIKYSRSVYHER